jgi:hypothetical protein
MNKYYVGWLHWHNIHTKFREHHKLIQKLGDTHAHNIMFPQA